MYVPVKDDISGERRKNIDLKILHSGADILKVIRKGRLRWVGHAWRTKIL